MEENNPSGISGNNPDNGQIVGFKQKGSGKEAKLRVRQLGVLEMFFVTFFGVAQFFHSPFHKFLCLLISYFFGCFALTIKLRNYTATKRNSVRWSLLAFSCVTILTAYALFFDNPQPAAPHFKFILNTGDFPQARVQLTNDSIMVKEFNKPMTVYGVLVVPVKITQSNVVLKLMVKNDSSEVPEFGQIMITMPVEWNAKPDLGWILSETPDTWVRDTSNQGQSWMLRLPEGMLPDTEYDLPEISISPQPLPSENGYLMIMAKAKHAPTIGLALKVFFQPPVYGAELVRPLLITPKPGGNGHAMFTLPTNEFRFPK